MKFFIGERVICSESGVIGDIIKIYTPTASEEQIMIKTLDKRNYHAPTRCWKPYQFGFSASQVITDELTITGIDLAQGQDMNGCLLNPYGEYIIKFAKNHGLSIDEAHQHPMCKARLAYFNNAGK